MRNDGSTAQTSGIVEDLFRASVRRESFFDERSMDKHILGVTFFFFFLLSPVLIIGLRHEGIKKKKTKRCWEGFFLVAAYYTE